jgi:hypothetical protein
MAIFDIGANSGHSVSSLTLTVPSGGIPAGATIVIFAGLRTGSTYTETISDSAGNTYTNPASVSDTDNNLMILRLWECYNCKAVSGSTTITITPNLSAPLAVSGLYITGTQTSADPYDSTASNTAQANSATPSCTLLAAPAVASSYVIGCVCAQINSSTTWTQVSGWAAPPDASASTGGSATNNSNMFGGSQVTSSQVTYNPTPSGSVDWTLILAVFKPAVASVASVVPRRRIRWIDDEILIRH